MPLDPHVRRLLDTLSMAQALGAATGGVRQRREAFRDLMRLSETGSRVAGIEDRMAGGPDGLPALRIYTPLEAPPHSLAGLIYLHGGGFVCGDLETYDALCRTLCQETGCRLIAVDYRLAPEHPFPAAVQDAQAATVWVIDHAAELGLDPARIAIAGDSAGATLAAVVCQLVARTHAGALALQLLLCPILDWAAETESRRAPGRGYLLDTRLMAEELACYLPAGHDARDGLVSPLRAADLRLQPPAYIHTAEFDVVRDDGCRYADKLRAAGVAVRHTCHAGMVHLFYGLGRLVPYACAMHRQIGAEVRAALAP
jgi:acetyl esterase/lipase